MYFAQLIDPSRHQLNQELSGALIWYIPLLILSLFLILGPSLQRINVRSSNLRSVIGASLLVIGIFILAGLAGLLTIGFGLCYGENCSEQAQAATGLIPALLSLVITIPVARKLIMSRGLQTMEKQPKNKLLLVIGLIILIWSSLIYVPRIVSIIADYRSSDTSESF